MKHLTMMLLKTLTASNIKMLVYLDICAFIVYVLIEPISGQFDISPGLASLDGSLIISSY